MRRDTVGGAGALVLELVLLLAMASVAVFGVVRPLLGPLGLSVTTGPTLATVPSVTVTLVEGINTEPALPQIGTEGVSEGEGIEMGGPLTAQVVIVNPSVRQRVAVVGPQVVGGLVTLGVLLLLLQVVRSLRQGDPFRPANARRLLGIAALVGIGGQVTVLFGVWSRMEVVNHPKVAPFVQHDVELSFLPLVAGLGIAVAAEVFRRGTRLRADVEGLV
jgi:hypothetical protein